MVEGDNSSGGTDKDEDIYCTIITGLIMFILPLMVFTFLQTPLSNHPLFSQFFVCSVSLFQAPCPLTPLLLNMLPTAASAWKLSCSLTGGSTLVIRVMTADEQYICCSEMVLTLQDSSVQGTVQLSLSPRRLWLLFTDDRLSFYIFFEASVLKGSFINVGKIL